VYQRVASRPFEVGVRADAGGIAQGQQDRGDGVGRCGSLGARIRICTNACLSCENASC
jgi:hypothetical protein